MNKSHVFTINFNICSSLFKGMFLEIFNPLRSTGYRSIYIHHFKKFMLSTS